MTWKIVEASKASVLYIYIDDIFTIFLQKILNSKLLLVIIVREKK